MLDTTRSKAVALFVAIEEAPKAARYGSLIGQLALFLIIAWLTGNFSDSSLAKMALKTFGARTGRMEKM